MTAVRKNFIAANSDTPNKSFLWQTIKKKQNNQQEYTHTIYCLILTAYCRSLSPCCQTCRAPPPSPPSLSACRLDPVSVPLSPCHWHRGQGRVSKSSSLALDTVNPLSALTSRVYWLCNWLLTRSGIFWTLFVQSLRCEGCLRLAESPSRSCVDGLEETRWVDGHRKHSVVCWFWKQASRLENAYSTRQTEERTLVFISEFS